MRGCGRDRSGIRPPLLYCQLIELLEEFDDKVVLFGIVDCCRDNGTFLVPPDKSSLLSTNDKAESEQLVLIGKLVGSIQDTLAMSFVAIACLPPLHSPIWKVLEWIRLGFLLELNKQLHLEEQSHIFLMILFSKQCDVWFE